jgi:nucleoside-diphosphate-sugar epimerase
LVRQKTDGPWDESVCHDLTRAASLGDAVHDIDTVYHLAGKTDDSKTSTRDATLFYQVNYDGTAKLVEAAAASGVERLVYLSSIKAMGSGGDARLDESSPANSFSGATMSLTSACSAPVLSTEPGRRETSPG